MVYLGRGVLVYLGLGVVCLKNGVDEDLHDPLETNLTLPPLLHFAIFSLQSFPAGNQTWYIKAEYTFLTVATAIP